MAFGKISTSMQGTTLQILFIFSINCEIIKIYCNLPAVLFPDLIQLRSLMCPSLCNIALNFSSCYNVF